MRKLKERETFAGHTTFHHPMEQVPAVLSEREKKVQKKSLEDLKALREKEAQEEEVHYVHILKAFTLAEDCSCGRNLGARPDQNCEDCLELAVADGC